MDWENQQGGKLDLTPEALGLGHTGSLLVINATPRISLGREEALLGAQPTNLPAHIFQIID